jgi:hemerythrin-like domain-containing protein
MREFTRTREVNTAKRSELCDRAVHLWGSHLDAENDVLYPEVRERAADLLPEILTAGERNELIERLVTDLDRLAPYDERLAAKMRVLAELTERHVDHDEQDLFPELRQAFGRNDLQRIGRQIRSNRTDDDRQADDPVSNLVRSILQ